MNIEELNRKVNIPEFNETVKNKKFLKSLENPTTLQVNVGKLCNLKCKHCHIEAGPDRIEIMNKKTMQACLDVFKKHGFKTIDITGGAPEMNPDIVWFIEECSKIAKKIIVRTNLVVLLTEKYKHMPEVFKRNNVNIVCSLPFYSKKNTDIQRGKDVYDKSIKALKLLNSLGYGIDPKHKLDIVFNPAGAYLPSDQQEMEKLYKERLSSQFGIVFNNLFSITNNPLGRFSDFLLKSGNLNEYMNILYSSFNPTTVEKIMCRDQISVSWDGMLYDCDFNQAAGIKSEGINNIFDLKEQTLNIRNIKTGKHCYACTAGLGSSCGGTIEK